MKQFNTFIIKEFIHILRDKKTILILFGIPIVQLLLFGFVISTEIKNASIGILDLSKDVETKKITSQISSSNYFIITNYLKDYKEIDRILKEGKVKQVIIFPSNFANDLYRYNRSSIQIIADASEPNTANLLVNYTTAIITKYIQQKNPEKKIYINTEVKMLYNPNLKSVYMFVPGIMALILMLISAMMASISIVREREQGSMEILLTTPLNPFIIILGKVIPYASLSIVNIISILSISYFVFEVPIRGNLFLLLFESILYIMVALSIGIFISTVAKNQMIAMFMSLVGLMLPTILLSGFIFPIENMPKILQFIAQLMPPKWFIYIIKNIMLKGSSLGVVLKETIILIFIMLFFIIVSIKKFKIRLQ